MEVLGAALLLGSGYFLNNQEEKNQSNKKITMNLENDKKVSNNPIQTKPSTEKDRSNATDAFTMQFFKKKDVTNPNFEESALWNDTDEKTLGRVKNRVDLTKKIKDSEVNDVGFKSGNLGGYDDYGNHETIPSIDDIDRDMQMIHSNMVPFFGSTIKQNTNDTAFTQHVLENYTGNFRHTRRDNKTEVESLFDPSPNRGLVNGASADMTTNRDQSRFFPSTTGKKHNELPFEQIQVGKGIGGGYSARPNGGFHQDVRILPKTTDQRRVNPKITYEGRVLPGKALNEKGKVIGQQTLKKPKAIMYNWNGERNFTGMANHRKNRYRSNVVLKCTDRAAQHRAYNGNASPVNKSKNTPDSLRGKNKIAHKRNFVNTPFRNVIQAIGKKMNDLGKNSYENKPTERSMQSTRTHYTNVTQAGGGKRAQQYNFNQNGLRYTRKQDTIANRPNNEAGGKAGPHLTTRGPVYDPNEVAKPTIRETTENNRHHGFVGEHTIKGPVYDTNEVAKPTIRETTENNRHHGFVGETKRKGPTYDQNEVAKPTIRETTENNRHHGFVGETKRKGPAYDQNEVAKPTIRETTENNRHHGFVGETKKKGPAYDQNEVARATIKETTEDNLHQGFVGKHTLKGKVFDQNDVAKTTIKETVEDNNHVGFVNQQHIQRGKVYDQNEVAKPTIRETTENNNYVPGVNSSNLQGGGGYRTNKYEAKNPQKAYLCNNQYIGAGEATSNKKPRTYDSEYQVNTNKEQIAVGRAPNEQKNPINVGKEGWNICTNKLDIDREVPYVMGKGSSSGNIYNPNSVTRCSITTRKNVTPTQVDRLQLDTLDAVKNNPLRINQNINA